MKDFNFFEPYLDKKEISSYNNIILYTVAAVVVLGMIIYPLVNVFKISSLKKHVAAMKTNLESSDIYERLDVVKQKKEKLSETEERLSLLKDVDNVIEGKDVINDSLLNKITGKVPKDAFLKSLNLSPAQIRIEGTATNNLAVAHLENNLRSDTDFKDVYIPSISLREGLHDFSINFALNDKEDDTKQDDVEQQDGTEQNNAEQKDVK